MCDVCEQAAGVVAANYGGTIDAEEVRKIVRAFQDESEKIIAEEAVDMPIPETIEIPAPGEIPMELLHAVASFSAGPIVLISATPLDGNEVALGVRTASIFGSVSEELTLSMLREAVKSVDSPLTETGGVTEDGKIVFPAYRGRVL